MTDFDIKNDKLIVREHYRLLEAIYERCRISAKNDDATERITANNNKRVLKIR